MAHFFAPRSVVAEAEHRLAKVTAEQRIASAQAAKAAGEFVKAGTAQTAELRHVTEQTQERIARQEQRQKIRSSQLAASMHAIDVLRGKH